MLQGGPAGFTDEDWEVWSRLPDPFLQYRILTEQYRKLGCGLMEAVLERELMVLAEREGEDPAKVWKKLGQGEKKSLLLRLLLTKPVVKFFRVVDQPSGGAEYYVALGLNNVLHDFDDASRNVVEALFGRYMREGVWRDLKAAIKTVAQTIHPTRVDSPRYLRLLDGVLDLADLSVKTPDEVDDYYFTYCAPLFTRASELRLSKLRIDEIKRGDYDVTRNLVYTFFRDRFEDRDWEYLVDALGTVLSPYRFKLLVFLIGGTDAGKSTLLRVLTKPIEPLVAWVSLSTLLNYTFGLESLLGRWVLVSTERGETVLRRLDLINKLFGESDLEDVPRKFKSAARLRSLKLGIIAMNDVPIVQEYGGETMLAFARRVSIIRMQRPEGAESIPNLAERIPPEEAFNFLLWCRWQLEQRGWVVSKMSDEEVIEFLRAQSNPVLKFLAEALGAEIEEHPEGRVRGAELYELYLKYCKEKGVTPVGMNTFYSVLATKYEKYHREKVVWFKGLRIRRDLRTGEPLPYEV